MQPLEGYQLEREGSHAVALELALDDELRREGLAREVVHAVQGARKDAGLDVSDRIALALGGDEELLAPRARTRRYVTGEVLAIDGRLRRSAATGTRRAIEGRALHDRRQRACEESRAAASCAARPGAATHEHMRHRAAAAPSSRDPRGRWATYADVCAAAGGVPPRPAASTAASRAAAGRARTEC